MHGWSSMVADTYAGRLDEAAERAEATLQRHRERNDLLQDDDPDRPGAATAAGTPEALRRPVPPPQPYPVAALGPTLAPAFMSLQRAIQAPDAICGSSLLAAASLCTQAHADVEIDGRVYPLTLWMLSVASSGERKSAVDGEVMRPLRDFEKTLAAACEGLILRYQARAEEWEALKSAAKKKHKTGVGLADALEEIGPAPLPPLRPAVIVGDFTAEGLAKLLAVGRPSMGAFTDEAGLVFGGHGMTKEAAARTAAFMSKIWDNGTLDRIRAGDGSMKLWGRRLAMHLMGQPVIIEGALSDDVLAGQGFLPRCLMAWPISTMGNRPYRQENLREDPALILYGAHAANLLERPLPLADGTQNELAPRTLLLSQEAGEIWRRLHDAIEAGMKPRGPFATVHAWASKMPEQAARIAGVLTLFDDPDAQEIGADAMERATELALWHLGEARRLAGTAAVSPEVRNAEALLAWVHEKGHAVIYSTLVLNGGPSCIRDNPSFRDAIKELERTSWARHVDGGDMIDGKQRKHVWEIRPPSCLE